jgi:uncharacterized membrane protein (Fun14 family)
MGGVVDVVEDGVEEIVDIVEEGVDDIVDTVEDVVEDAISSVADVVKKVYLSVADDMLGIDDEKFLGVGGYVGAKLGTATKDVLHDHAEVTVAIVGAYLIGYYGIQYIGMSNPSLYVNYSTYLEYAAVGIDYGMTKMAENIEREKNKIYELMIPTTTTTYGVEYREYIEYTKYQSRVQAEYSFFNLLKSSEMYVWLAGGTLHNAVDAGGELYDTNLRIDKYSKVFGYPDEVETSEVLQSIYPYSSYAGGDFFDLEYKKLLV